MIDYRCEVALGRCYVVPALRGVCPVLDHRDSGAEAIGHQVAETEVVASHGHEHQVGLRADEVCLRTDRYLTFIGVVLRPGQQAAVLLKMVVDREEIVS